MMQDVNEHHGIEGVVCERNRFTVEAYNRYRCSRTDQDINARYLQVRAEFQQLAVKGAISCPDVKNVGSVG